MLVIDKVEVYGWECAIRGMRNPLNSWAKSDSTFEPLSIGENDLDLMKRLKNAGTDHRKYLRMIQVSLDITAPIYWWKEYDTYKVGTVANSCSTMHKIHSKPFVLSDFSTEHLDMCSLDLMRETITLLNYCRGKFNDTKDKRWWWQMIQMLPTSYNQKRTVLLNYEVLSHMYHSRKNHKLDEWVGFCAWIEKCLPFATDLIC